MHFFTQVLASGNIASFKALSMKGFEMRISLQGAALASGMSERVIE